MDMNKEREIFEQYYHQTHSPIICRPYPILENGDYKYIEIDKAWKLWQAATKVPEGFVLVDKKNIEHWYLNDRESMWWEHTDWLCDISIGEVEEVEHKQYLVTDESKKYAAITWDEANDDVGYYELFDTREEAEKAAAYCDAKFATHGEVHE